MLQTACQLHRRDAIGCRSSHVSSVLKRQSNTSCLVMPACPVQRCHAIRPRRFVYVSLSFEQQNPDLMLPCSAAAHKHVLPMPKSWSGSCGRSRNSRTLEIWAWRRARVICFSISLEGAQSESSTKCSSTGISSSSSSLRIRSPQRSPCRNRG